MGKARDGRCSVVLCGQRLQMEKSVSRLSTIHNCREFLLCRNSKRTLGENPRGTGETSTDGCRAKRRTQLRNIDSQSVKTTLAAEEHEINDEKTKGRKRHIVVGATGSLLTVVVHATVHDTKSGILATRDAFEQYPSIQRFFAETV